MRIVISVFFGFLSFIQFGQSYSVVADTVAALKGASIRGMSVVDDSVAWVSGSRGSVARTLNGGRTWERIEVKGFEKRDFRSIEAFDKDHAYIANAGDSATLFYTNNGGRSWTLLFSFPAAGAFFDAISCWNIDSGLVLSDPVNRMFMLPLFSPHRINAMQTCFAQEGESCFAASGTCLRTAPGGRVCFVTGGSVSRMFTSSDYGKSWVYVPLPIIQGQASQGAFSVSFFDEKNGIVVGGDYAQPQLSEKNCFYTRDAGKSWQASRSGPSGYRSCVENIAPKKYICTGSSGSDLTKDGGKSWSSIDHNNFNVVRKAKKGELVLFAGDKGRVGKLVNKK